MTFAETLLLAEVTVATVFFILLPAVSALKGERVYISQGYFDNIRTILVLFLMEIALLLVAIYLQYFPIGFSSNLTGPIAEAFMVSISVAFFLTLTFVLRIGYKLLAKLAGSND